MKKLKGFRSSILHFIKGKNMADYEFFEDGLLVTEDGIVKELGDYAQLSKKYPKDLCLKDYSGKLIMPGFIDTHIHYPQTDIIGSYGEQLLEWLKIYTFPTEIKFGDKIFAKEVSEFFTEELLRNGTTTAMVFCTVHLQSADAFFETAREKNMRMIAGKISMDRNAPEKLLEDSKTDIENSLYLINKWHNKGRLSYAITPRFAPTSTEQQLKSLSDLYSDHKTLYMQTHLSENVDELNWVKSLFPSSKNYLDVYENFNLVKEKSVFAHCVHLEDDEFDLLKKHGSSISFCPGSNMFLGSGLFNYEKAKEKGINIGIGSDVGAGTSFSILRNLGDAYKICQLNKQKLPPLEAFYMATLGGAKALSLDDKIGNFETGKEADFVVIDFEGTKLMKRRYETLKTLEEKLFMLMILGGEENIYATYIMGEKLYSKE